MPRSMRMVVLCLLVLRAVTGADVSYVEEVVNSGIGPQKAGARKTTRRVFIKGPRQRVEHDIEADGAVRRSLRRRGQELTGNRILQLDAASLFEMEGSASAYTRQALPAPKAVPSGYQPGQPANMAPLPKAVATGPSGADPNREISFRARTLSDTLRIHGILCHRTAAQMRARHFVPGTRKVRRENRYLRQAWVATGFPGYDEIEAFRRLQEKKTSQPPLVGDALDEIGDTEDEYGRFRLEMSEGEGFTMQSRLQVFVKTGTSDERRIFALSRRITAISHEALADSLFEVPEHLRLTDE